MRKIPDPCAADQEKRRGVGRAQDRREQPGAVRISPLQVVDEKDEWDPVRQTCEQLPEGCHRAPPKLLGIRYLLLFPPRPRDHFHPPEYGKEAR